MYCVPITSSLCFVYTHDSFRYSLLYFLQAQLKETNLSADEAARAKEELAARLRDLEKKVRTIEQDLSQAQEVSYTVHHTCRSS